MAKTVNLDSMFKAVMKSYDLPSRQDIEKLSAKLDRIEKLIKQTSGKTAKASGGKTKNAIDRSEMTASGIVLKVVKNSRKGADFSRIQLKTGFEDKKLRNIIFRLNKIGKIKRQARGVYVVT